MSGALARFLGDKAFYCRLLAAVPQEADFAELGEALTRGDLKDAFEHAHALKGVLGNMGLTPMYDEACLIVEPLRAGGREGVDGYYRTLMEQREKLLHILGAQ